MKSVLLGTGLAVLAIALPSAGSAQAPASCTPGSDANVTLRTEDEDGGTAIVATHEASVIAEIQAADPTHVEIVPQGGGDVVRGNGENVDVIAPAASSLTLLISWRQSA